MSYEGYIEFLCLHGHYIVRDAYEPDPEKCPTCEEPIKYWRSVDTTNGVEADNPGTQRGKTEQIGYTDIWQRDHYGNKYAYKIERHRPIGDDWRLV